MQEFTIPILQQKSFKHAKVKENIRKQEKSLSVKADTEKIEMKNSSYKYVLYIQENRGNMNTMAREMEDTKRPK